MWFAEPERFPVDLLAAMVAKVTGAELHLALAPQAVWRPDDARLAFDRTVEAALARYHVPTRDEPTFADLARLLTTPAEARFGWLSDTTTGVNVSTLVAADQRFGVVAVREGQEISVRTFQRDRLSKVLADVLPQGVRKSPEPSLTVLRSEVRGARQAEMNGTRPSRAVMRADYLASLEPYFIAELHAEVRDHSGQPRHPRFPLRVYDNAEGRWTVLTKPHYDDQLLHFAPATAADVADRLDDLRRELT
ncbi:MULTISPECIES: ESX secretion-associated protein EspG [Amycolatopsis]|uniref:ESX secretion-associated protein EspG n=1 Tax=Amycolatopsis thermalba TaxID=944492 RepID=A0ABY4P4P6_9PSEU|nr:MULTISPECIES: ESX secretion-associated protein EspG [Amycolatopsis]OXM73305.1 ESX secretion-associated protein EspG [Amycolatopsis sp. KNN50.9b]UQS27371.1 ESX secretion-associated protein EspG [Amycolatopsis thermalba]